MINKQVVCPTLQPSADKLFTFSVYDFGDLMGTTVISFGKKDGEESYTCLIGARAYDIDNYKEESHFWVFPNEVKAITDQVIAVSRLNTKNYIRLQTQNTAGSKQFRNREMFSFYAKA